MIIFRGALSSKHEILGVIMETGTAESEGLKNRNTNINKNYPQKCFFLLFNIINIINMDIRHGCLVLCGQPKKKSDYHLAVSPPIFQHTLRSLGKLFLDKTTTWNPSRRGVHPLPPPPPTTATDVYDKHLLSWSLRALRWLISSCSISSTAELEIPSFSDTLSNRTRWRASYLPENKGIKSWLDSTSYNY